MDLFLQQLIMTLLLGVLFYCFFHICVVRRRLERRRAAAERVLELAAVTIQSMSFGTPEEAKDVVRSIEGFRVITKRELKGSDRQKLEEEYFSEYWRGAHQVLAGEERDVLRKLSLKVAHGSISDPLEIAGLLTEQEEATRRYYYHYTEGKMARLDAQEEILKSRGLLARFPRLERLVRRVEERVRAWIYDKSQIASAEVSR